MRVQNHLYWISLNTDIALGPQERIAVLIKPKSSRNRVVGRSKNGNDHQQNPVSLTFIPRGPRLMPAKHSGFYDPTRLIVNKPRPY